MTSNQQLQKIFAIYFSNTNPDDSIKGNTFYRGGGGGGGLGPQKPKVFLKKIERNFKVRFYKFIFYFWAGLPKSPNYELDPQLS